LPPVIRSAPKNQSNKGKTQKSALQVAGGKFVDALGAAAIKKLKVKLGLNTETKYVDTAGTTTATGTLVKRIASPTIAQGLTVNTRSGNSVRITRCDLRIWLQVPAATTTPSALRLIVVRHREADEAAVAEILQSTTDISSPIANTAVSRGVQLLMDKVYTLGTTAGGPSSLYINKSFSSPDWQMIWQNSDTTGVPTNLLEGAISVFWMVADASTAPVLTSTMRSWFVDN
jgi:hypothetical protein